MSATNSTEELQREAAKLRKINAALMSRVERSMDQQFNAFSLFETAIALDQQVRERTRQLRDALHSIETANKDLYRAKQQAEAASSLKSSVLISVTHDLLQPLNAARLTLSTLADEVQSDRGTSMLGQVDRSLAMLEDLLRSLLDIAKLDAGALRPDVRPILLSSLFEPLEREFAPIAAKRGLSLRICPSSLAVVSDAMMLRRILQNLLANALRYTRRGGVVMGCRRGLGPGRVRIEVYDTGPGIPKPQQEAIFLEFQRGQPSAEDQAGFGLGLSIVRRFANALDHQVRLASRIDHGSTFTLELDRADPAAVPPEPLPVDQIQQDYSGLEGARILLIENDPAGAEAMVSLLEKWGCDVMAAVSLQDAVERLGVLGAVPETIIADLHLDGDESGIVAIRDLRQVIGSDVPAMIVTADYSEAAAKEASLYGLEILTKPVRPAELRALLSFLLN
ncbi:hybrid sensor histidine kinase/response regulator [Bradyrhizobium sp. STM 3809]|uniref:hybrid sensor histidine kinase/response regulator n=1 Tax=Bradyrhizobium sp. STM 3809 TaxID=551936 RepID=UPI0002407BD0|nr:hybrid sensor histidine kinase/response regulator [Bradyrhizobium sp. STM 3809]CCD98346.1 Two-component hybrid sensor and regulator [Bradyrhizobium sp. STM 3809]